MAETIVLLIAVYDVLSCASFEATLINVGKAQTQWRMLIVMLLGLFMNASINHAFREVAWTFVMPFFGMPNRAWNTDDIFIYYKGTQSTIIKNRELFAFKRIIKKIRIPLDLEYTPSVRIVIY